VNPRNESFGEFRVHCSGIKGRRNNYQIFRKMVELGQNSA
jgi:hypothetical protein